MSKIVEIFLKEIPQIIHEPIAITAVIGIVLAAVCYARRPFGKFYWLILCTLLYMFAWRLAIQIISSRYAEILLYPAVISAAYACFKFPELIYLSAISKINHASHLHSYKLRKISQQRQAAPHLHINVKYLQRNSPGSWQFPLDAPL